MFKIFINNKTIVLRQGNLIKLKTQYGVLKFLISNFMLIKNGSILINLEKFIFYSLYILYKGLILMFFNFIELYGLGYKVNVYNNLFKLKLGLSHYIFIKSNTNFFIKVLKKNKLIFNSIFQSKIFNFSSNFYFYKKPNKYKRFGFFLNKNYNMLKVGKIFLL